MIWKRIFGCADRDEVPYAIYNALVAQARQPWFYLDGGVPDTLEGRFEMVMLHAFLVLRRMKALGDPAREVGQRVFDIMFDDMDQTLREIGVGDLSVGKKIKGMAAAFYGRIAAYDEGLDAEEPGVLDAALKRNLFAMAVPSATQVSAVANYLRLADGALATQEADTILAGAIRFPVVPVEENRSVS